MIHLGRDLRVAFLRLRKSPLSSLMIVLTLALCIGTSTALFSIIKGALLDPWPYKGQDRIVVLAGDFPKLGQSDMQSWSIPEYVDLSRQTEIFDGTLAGVGHDVNLTDGDQPEHLHAVQITADGFRMLGVTPLLGRYFTPEEDRPGAEKVAVMAYGLWQRRYAGDPHIVGKTLRVAGESYQVIGVMPSRFRWWDANLWFPLGLDLSATDRSQRRLVAQARLRPGVSLKRAQAQLASLARRIESDHLGTNPEYERFGIKLRYLRDEVLRDLRLSLIVLLAFMIVVYLMACTNIANLLLAEAAARRREMAVRRALGASRGQLVRQLLVECLVFTLPGALMGLGLAVVIVRSVLTLIPYGYIPAEAVIEVGPSAAVFSLVLALVAAVLCGMAPAREASRPTNLEALREGGQRSIGTLQVRRFQDLLVVAEVVMALMVLAAAGLMIQSYVRLTAVSPGFDPKGVLTLRIALPADRYAESSQVAGFVQELLRRARSIPGVQAAGAVSTVPLTGGASRAVTVEGRSATELGVIPQANMRIATAGYFQTLRIPLVQGRTFGDQDVESSQPVVIVNQTMARRLWPGQNPLGKRMKIGGATSTDPWLTVVGIAGDVREDSLDTEPRQQFYLPFPQRPFRGRDLALTVRSSLQPESLSRALREAVLALDPGQPVYDVRTLEEIVVSSLGAKRLTLVLLSIFGLTSLLLAGLGIFAVLAHLVNNRQQEIGVRMALGAQVQTVVGLFVGHGLRLAAIGLLIGLFIASFSSRVLASLVYGVSTSDPLTFAGIAVLFGIIAVVASYIPARRAARVDPVVSLNGG
jgi:putative ABC transport system permease protein